MREGDIKPGDVFGKLTVIEFAGRDNRRHGLHKVRCACGKAYIVQSSKLILGIQTCKECYEIGRQKQKEITLQKKQEIKELNRKKREQELEEEEKKKREEEDRKKSEKKIEEENRKRQKQAIEEEKRKKRELILRFKLRKKYKQLFSVTKHGFYCFNVRCKGRNNADASAWSCKMAHKCGKRRLERVSEPMTREEVRCYLAKLFAD